MDVNNGQDTLTLYNFPVSTCSQKVDFSARRLLPFTNFEVDWRNQDHLSSWYLAINPNGVVPTLKHGTRIVIDSSVINEYLDEVFPDKPLLPREPYARAKVRSWRQYIDEVPTTAIRIPSFNLVILKNMKNLTEEAFAARATKRPLRKHFYQKMSPSGFSQLEFDQALERLRQTLERMERALAETRWVARRIQHCRHQPHADHRAARRPWPQPPVERSARSPKLVHALPGAPQLRGHVLSRRAVQGLDHLRGLSRSRSGAPQKLPSCHGGNCAMPQPDFVGQCRPWR